MFFDPSGRSDALGSRAKIGVMVPTTNTIVQPEFDDLRPPGVTNHVARIEPSSAGIAPGDVETYAKRLERGNATILKGIGDLVPCAPDMIVLAHSINSFRGGFVGARKMKAELETHAGGTPVILPSLAFLAALDVLGVGQRVSVLTPFWAPGDAQVRTFLESAGHSVCRIKGLECPGPLSIASVRADDITRLLDELAADKPDVILQPGTNMASARVAAVAWERHGIPVLSCNTTTYWHALRSLSINDRRTGFGALMAEH